jgi:branched-subunit amino acid permease
VGDFVKTTVVRLFLSRSGPLLVNVIAALAAWLSLQASKYVPHIDTILTPELIAAAVFLLVSELVTRLPASLLKDYGRQVQAALNEAGANLKVDGIVLVKTAQAVQDKVKP